MSLPSLLLPPPILYRRNVPFYYNKSKEQFRNDKYEVYNPTVIRSFSKYYNTNYGATLLKEINRVMPSKTNLTVAELGCGTGFLLGGMAQQHTNFQCIGLDFSYQMLKIATQVFNNAHQNSITKIEGYQNGIAELNISNANLSNISFALSDACATPLMDNSIDFCYSIFLWDRVKDPLKLIKEQIRITKPGGSIMIISPFNYLSTKTWQDWYPVEKCIKQLEALGLCLEHHNHFTLEEQLDFRNNKIVWKVESLVFKVK